MNSTKPKANTVIAALFGNALEWYDFILYANFAPIIAALFFPSKNPFVSLLLTFVVFATGFFVRPLGALVFGYLGDHMGRRKALIFSIFCITIPTCLIGFLPTYQHIGILAPLLLTLLRLIQGLAVSGELNTATSYLIEHVSHRRGVAGSLIMGTAFLGILIGGIAATVITIIFSPEMLHHIGWRIPFWIGGALGIIGIIIRLRSKESPKFLQEQPASRMSALKEVWLYFRKELLLAIGVTSIMAVANYILIAYVITFLVKFQGFTLETANLINLIAMFVMLPLFPIAGDLSDRFGRKLIFKIGLLGFIFLSLPIFWLLSQKSFGSVLVGDILLILTLVPIAALIPTLIAELFPTRVRNTGTTVGYNVALALLGGTTPIIALALVKVTQNTLIPAVLTIFFALLALFLLRFIKESHQEPLI